MELINGKTYQRQDGWRFVLVYLMDKWGMLHIERHTTKGMSAPIFQSDKSGNFQFSERQLKKDWHSDSWVPLDGCLRIEKTGRFAGAALDEINE